MRIWIRRLAVFVAGLTICVAANAAHAGKATIFTATITGGQIPNVPAGLSPSPGFGVLFGTLQGNDFCYSISYQGLLGNETVSHFHGPAVPGAVSTNHLFPPQTPGCAGPTCPSLAAGSPKDGCTGQLDKAAVKALKKGQWYINIHTDMYMAGEIRGQILPTGSKFKAPK